MDSEQRELGLTWSKRWHVIDPVSSEQLRKHHPSPGGTVVSLCGAYLYTREEVLEKKRPSHLLRLLQLDNPLAGAPLCKKCEKSEIRDVASR